MSLFFFSRGWHPLALSCSLISGLYEMLQGRMWDMCSKMDTMVLDDTPWKCRGVCSPWGES